MKKLFLVVLGLAGLLALLPTAQAITYPFESGVYVGGANPGYSEGPFQRYYTTLNPKINPACTTGCIASPFGPCDTTTAGGPYCTVSFNTNKQVFRGYTENVANFSAGLADATVFYAIYDAKKADGSVYYAWVAAPVNNGVKSDWQASSCVGTRVSDDCLGNATVLNTVPIPKGFDLDSDGNAYAKAGVKGTFQLKWNPAVATGESSAGLKALGYDLYYAKLAGEAGCPTVPTNWTFLKTHTSLDPGSDPEWIAETSAEIGYQRVGMANANEPACVWFALKIRYPNADTTNVLGRYVGKGYPFLTGGLAANVYDLAAKFVGKTNVEVSWKTSLEDGVRGFYVTRALAQNGTYTRVSDLIAANGEPSAYSFIDTLTKPTVPVKTTGLYYKVESVDIDDAVTPYGPVKVQMPTERNTVIQDRTKKAPRR